VSAQWTLWAYQNLFLKETEEAIERAITGLVRPFLVKYYERLLFDSSESQLVKHKSKASLESLYLTYNNDMELMRDTLYEHAFETIRKITFAEMLVLGNVSKQYLEGIRVLIRHSDEELSSIMFQLNQELSRIPLNLQRQISY
jgi:hypothetical protein